MVQKIDKLGLELIEAQGRERLLVEDPSRIEEDFLIELAFRREVRLRHVNERSADSDQQFLLSAKVDH